MNNTASVNNTASLAESAVTRTQHRRRYLMCRPEHFTVSYTINPWMEPANPTDTARALRQWKTLYDTYIELGHEVELIDPVDGLPDMVYTANGGFLIDGIAYGPKFRFQERAGEEGPFIEWFRANGFDTRVPEEVNEGEGDFLLVGDTILAGTGFRSTGDSHREVGEVFGREVVTLTLTDPRFYHLDTAIAVLDPIEGVANGGPERANIAYLPAAFDEASQAILAERYPDAIHVSDEDGAVFGLNSASDGRNVLISPRAKGFERQLRERGYNPVLIDLSELLLGGGGIKCCTLELRGASS
ncbi:dimethylargininase [Microbacterium sp.]|uniref:dimethylargininase n=1 Tax=Microbacterium sp. TaxID=51671 RepID=UPI0032C2377F